MTIYDTALGKTSVHQGDCLEWLGITKEVIDLSFLDPPFNQGREYRHFDDNQNPQEYWTWMTNVLHNLNNATSDGGAVYFMQREKNSQFVLEALSNSGWTFQNLIIWKKLTSAVPGKNRFGKHYQIIAFATKGRQPRIFNRLRIDPPLKANYKYSRQNGVYVTDIWDDIRELTSGYFAGDEPVRTKDGNRFHNQQSPLGLLTRIILSSSLPNDTVFDPFAGTGTALVAATQLQRNSIGIEMDPINISCIKKRLSSFRSADNLMKYYEHYRFTNGINKIWGNADYFTDNMNANYISKQKVLV